MLTIIAKILPHLPKDVQKQIHVFIGETINAMFTEDDKKK